MRRSETLRSSGGLDGLASELDRAVGHVRIEVWLEGPNSAFIEWSTSKSHDVDVGWSWSVERCASPAGPFLPVAIGLAENLSTGRFRDDGASVQGYENTRRLYYRIVRVPHTGQAEVYGLNPDWDKLESSDTSWGVTWGFIGQRTEYAPGVVREARSRIRRSFESYDGERALIYRPSWDRGSCSVCVDPRTGERVTGPSGCSSCFGTGYEGGFYTPMWSVLVPKNVIAPRVDSPAGGHDLKEVQVYRTLAHPLLEPDDLVRTLDGKIYEIAQVDYEEMYGAVLCQVAHLTQHPRAHALSRIPFPIDSRKTARFSRSSLGGVITNLTDLERSVADGARDRATARSPDDPWGDA